VNPQTLRPITYTQIRRPGQSIGEPEPPVAWIRFAIQQSATRLLRVLIYARYSTDDQNPHSIDAQIAYCKRFLRALGITDYELIVIQDVELSGELKQRPGIDQVWSGIEACRWDLILVEDASRLYRHDSWAVDLVYRAVDKQMRVICINDSVDTADDQRVWIPKLKDATRSHAQANQYTRDRIRRAFEHLWAQGAAVGGLRPGYRRIATTPAAHGEKAKGPFFDEIDEKWALEIVSAFEQSANQDPPWKVAKYLTEKGVPKAANSTRMEWTEENVRSLIRETLYRGLDVYGETVWAKQLSTGKRNAQQSDAQKVLTREMSHLRIVSDELWHQANAAIDTRRPCRDYLSGPDNPLFGVPRDSRGLLTTLFKCGICGAPMHKGGRGGRAYVCSAARKRKCWNRATAEHELIENASKQIVREQLRSVDHVVDEFLRRLTLLIGDRDSLCCRADALTEKKKKLNLQISRLINIITNKTNPPGSVLRQIEKLEGRVRKIAGKRNQLKRLLSGSMIPTRRDVMDRLEAMVTDLDADQMTAGVALRKVIRRIEAIPFLQFNSSVVVLRGRIIVDVAGLLSVELASVLSELNAGGIEKEFEQTTVIVDLYKPSSVPAFGLEAEALDREQQMSARKVGNRLGLTKRVAHLAIQYGRALRQAGLEDPYVELKSAPEKAAHWGPHKNPRRLGANSRKPGRPAPSSASS
jgi:DNA invertase Pin-like site-specific DNA recombinase